MPLAAVPRGAAFYDTHDLEIAGLLPPDHAQRLTPAGSLGGRRGRIVRREWRLLGTRGNRNLFETHG